MKFEWGPLIKTVSWENAMARTGDREERAISLETTELDVFNAGKN